MESTDKIESDAKRMKTRSFAGYLSDRIRGKADFSNEKDSSAAKADKPNVPFHTGDKERNPDAYADGGSVKSKRPQYR